MDADDTRGAGSPYRVIAIVASAGGHAAVAAVLRGLPRAFPVPVLVVQHLAVNSTSAADFYRHLLSIPFDTLQDGSPLIPGTVLIAPPRVFVELMPDGTCALKPCARGAIEKPLDYFLDSVARSFGRYAIGVVLTGMANDGAAGARRLRDAGGRLLVQSPASAEYPDMPRAAIEAGAGELVLPLTDIGQVIADIVAGTPHPKARSEIAAVDAFFAGAGAARAQLRGIDWSETPLGPVLTWPQSLRTTVQTALASPIASAVHWGARHVLIGNDAYLRAFPEARATQGQPGDAALTGDFERLRGGGEATRHEDQLRLVTRDGVLQESYYTSVHTRLCDETGAVSGVLSTWIETTATVLAARRLKTLRTLVDYAASASTITESFTRTAAALATNPHDIPIALIYALDKSRSGASLMAATGVETGTPRAPHWIDLRAETQPWPIQRALEGGVTLTVDDLTTRFPGLTGVWPEPIRSATILLLRPVPESPPTGVLILGSSPRLAADAAYRDFFDIVASRIISTTAEAAAREYERERLDRLRELDRAKTEFFANVSHEFRTPLTLLLAPLEDLLRQRDALPAAAARDLDVAARNARRLLGLVNDLLDFSEIESRRRGVALEEIDVRAVTADVASAFRSAIEAAGLRLRIACDERLPSVVTNREMWERIVSNLLSNAFKFTFEGEISVTVSALPLHAQLVVADTGIGIPRDELRNIFKRFHRVRGARARTAEGSGIGLSLVDDLVKRMGGQIRVVSTEGRGTRFTIWMPYKPHRTLAPADGDAAGHASTAAAVDLASEASRWISAEEQPEGILEDLVGLPANTGSTRRGHIVVVDDNADMRQYLRRLLTPAWDVHTANDGEEAFATLTRVRPDVLLADVMMPNMDGFELLKRVRQDAELKHIPVVLVTARAGEEAAIEGLLAGADDYIAKPFSPRELVARVRAVAERAGVEAALRQRAAWLSGQREALEAALNDAPLETSLGALVATATEALGAGTRGAFYLANAEGTTLHHVVGMPADYAREVDGFRIGPDSLACGLATATGEPVVTFDVNTDPRWIPWRSMAARFNYRGCWGFPIRTSAGRFVGTFAVYSQEPRTPTTGDLELATLLTQTASIILSRHMECEARQRAQAAVRADHEHLLRGSIEA